ncbi:putative Short chain dehydrogenase/reductase [Taphrina deformans PYCC 5710]|uniref:Short chain dehydrogenase/reductase n=1 Tax=Taphrina deformans (strain PYCC 5710 / ATCC 11124 / CBS 356.35 / IMI 108563 / JCM 9778 / NBRC 8474) TaxID=1097556 RepID=R4XBG3_TAPDE|nr:putative Short chain dehydrogenase/reductase [Taphrina deformans PYCC 5710]|eukprot:CCG81711.1 putative Short chain dehydrogenase/reductase [Taphrina deformans PYCC 5710]
MYDWTNKVVVLTGGASGMGRSFITHVLSHGGIVSFGDINTALSKSLLLQVHSSAPRLVSRLLFTKTDIRDANQVRHLFDRTKEVFGKIDCLLCVAGVNLPDSFLPPAEARPATANMLNLEINLIGTINTVYAGLSYLKSGASIVVIASTAGIYPSSVQPLYSASKHGLIGFSRSLAPILPEGQRIFVLAPSTYLPPHQQSTSGLKMSGQMDNSGDDDIFTKVIRNTLGFVEMSSITKVLDESLESAQSGQVIEINPTAVQSVAFPVPTDKITLMENSLRYHVCGIEEKSAGDNTKVKEEAVND